LRLIVKKIKAYFLQNVFKALQLSSGLGIPAKPLSSVDAIVEDICERGCLIKYSAANIFKRAPSSIEWLGIRTDFRACF